MLTIHNQKVFAVTVSCGVILAALCWICYRTMQINDSVRRLVFDEYWAASAFVALPSSLLYLLVNYVGENSPIRFPLWFVELIAFSYYPIVGALIGRSKHWLVWCIVLLIFHAILVALLAWVISRVTSKIGF